MTSEIRIGIDASNLRIGGGVTHLIEVLNTVDIEKYDIAHITVWGCIETLDVLPDRSWLSKISIGSINKDYLRRVQWQRLRLSAVVKKANCDVLYIPGGNFIGGFRPTVTMSRNMLPFQWAELSRYRFSMIWFRLLVLRQLQSYSFKSADGMIFLTNYAREAVQTVSGKLRGKVAVIPHGMNTRFTYQPKEQQPISAYSAAKPFRLIYVSIIDLYKHQWHVVAAVNLLRKEGFPVELTLIGPSYEPAMVKLRATLATCEASGSWMHYRGKVPYAQLNDDYAEADLGVFASSCENMPNILLETMAAGLPVACSNRGPMPEVLGDAGVYFNPESPLDIAQAIKEYLLSPALRQSNARKSFERSQQYSWAKCADQTMAFLAETARSYQA